MRKLYLSGAVLVAAGALGFLTLSNPKVEERGYIGKGHVISEIAMPKIMPASAFDSN